MNATDIDRAIAALTPQQREAWRQQWQLVRWKSAPFETWLCYVVTVLAATAELRLQRHGY